MLIDRHLPRYEFVERHAMFIPASPDRVLAAVKQLRSEQVRLAAPLFFLRSIPASIRTLGRRPQSRDFTRRGHPMLDAFIPLDSAERELVFGLAGRFWQLDGGRRASPHDAREFALVSDPTLATAVINFVVEPALGGTRLSTETRVHVEDQRSRAKFRWYWRLIQPGSALIRRSMLSAVRRAVRS